MGWTIRVRSEIKLNNFSLNGRIYWLNGSKFKCKENKSEKYSSLLGNNATGASVLPLWQSDDYHIFVNL